jgi:hypothetical protein
MKTRLFLLLIVFVGLLIGGLPCLIAVDLLRKGEPFQKVLDDVPAKTLDIYREVLADQLQLLHIAQAQPTSSPSPTPLSFSAFRQALLGSSSHDAGPGTAPSAEDKLGAIVWDKWQNEPSAYSADNYGEDNFRLYEFRVGQSPVDKNGYQTHGIEFRQKPLLEGQINFLVKFSREDFTEADFTEWEEFSEVTGLMNAVTGYPPNPTSGSHQSIKAIAKVKLGQRQAWKADKPGGYHDQAAIGTIKSGQNYSWHWRSRPVANYPNCLDEWGESYFKGHDGLGIVEVYYREKGSLFQYKIQNPLTTAMDVHYVMAGDDLQAMRKAPRKAVHVPAGDCADVVQPRGKHLYIFDFSFPALNWKQETLLGTGQTYFERLNGLSGQKAVPPLELSYEFGDLRAPKERLISCLGNLNGNSGSAKGVARLFRFENGKNTLWKIFNDFEDPIRVEYETQLLGEDAKPEKPCVIEPFGCLSVTVSSEHSVRITSVSTD